MRRSRSRDLEVNKIEKIDGEEGLKVGTPYIYSFLKRGLRMMKR